MRERELALALDRGAPLTADEPLPLEGVEGASRRLGVPTDRARPEHLADDRGILEQLLLARREAVEAGGDDALERLRQRQLLRRAPLEVELDELLGVERIPARALEQSLLRVRREHRAVEQLADQLGRLLVREGRERECRRVQLAAAPAGAALEELGPRGRDDEERNIGHPIDELVDEVQEALVRPVDVLDDEDERALLRDRLEEPAPRRERLAAAVAAQLRSPIRARGARAGSPRPTTRRRSRRARPSTAWRTFVGRSRPAYPARGSRLAP